MALDVTEFLPTKTYTFEHLRKAMGVLPRQQGVIGSGDFVVSQRGAGANLSVDVAAGDAWVNGTTNSRQGLYHLFNNATVNVAPISGANATKPRVDQIILVANDSSVIGTTDVPELVIVEGTPTTGAQISATAGANYRAGAKTDTEIRATHPNFVRLADVLIPAAATKVETSNIIDRRPWAGGFQNYVEQAAGGYSGGTSVLANNIRLECVGNAMEIRGVISVQAVYGDASEKNFTISIKQDGIQIYENFHRDTGFSGGSGQIMQIPLRIITTPTAGSHLYTATAGVSGTSYTSLAAFNPQGVLFSELLRNANNGVA